MLIQAEKQQLMHRVEHALDAIRPHLQADGGDIEVLDITAEYILEVKWLGNCKGCPMSFMTMRAGVEQSVKTAVPEIQGVVAV